MTPWQWENPADDWDARDEPATDRRAAIWAGELDTHPHDCWCPPCTTDRYDGGQ